MKYLKTLLLTVATLAALGAGAAERPNILWIVADDLCPDLGCYGDKVVHTPNLDKLAAEGVRYDAAFTTAPVCSASRSGFFTGVYQTTIGAQHHRSHRNDGFKAPEGVHHLTWFLHNAGYFTCNTTDDKEFGSNSKTDYNFDSDHIYDANSWSKCPKGKPFFAYANIKEPHRGFVKPSAVPNPVNPADVILPPYYADHPVVRQDWADYLNSVAVLDTKVGKILAKLEADGLADNTVVIFFGDHGRPMFRGKQFLYDGGIRVPLIVRWPANPQWVKPGSVSDSLISGIDFTATSLTLAGIDLPPSMQGRSFLGPDAKPRDYIYAARDRCDGTMDRIRCVRDHRFKYIRNFMPERPWSQFNSYKERSYPPLPLMRELNGQGKLNAAQARFFSQDRPTEELYDLKADPFEIHNLADDPKFKQQLEKYRGLITQWIKDTHDQGEIPEDPKVTQAEYEGMMRKDRQRTGGK